MPNQFDEFLAVIESFNKFQVDYIIIGGVAMILHGFERLTRDVDIFILLSEENIERLKKSLHAIFDDSSIDEITLNELRQYPVIRYGTPHGFNVDIITKLGIDAKFEEIEYQLIEIQGIPIRIATPDSLYKLKKNTMRERDKMDIQYLKELIKRRKKNRT